jgi:5-methyltetrahydropteroyltriglutamate--homocysteine methyltransferase
LAGIDVITGGEMHRRTHNRHAPPNAMLNHFWQKIPAFQGATKAKPITPHDPDVFHPAATCKARITDNIDLGLVNEFQTVSALTGKPVKITMTGPHMLAKVAYDEFYNDLPKMMDDLGKLLRNNFRKLAAAGCRHIQIDEPLFTMSDDNEIAAAVDTINLAIEGLDREVHVSVHICQGNYAVGKEYDAQIGHRYFDVGRYKADLSARSRLRPISSSMTWRTTTRAISATGSSASARSTCRIPRSRAAKPWPDESAKRRGSRPNKPLSPVPAASTICPGRSPSASSRP